MFQNILYSNLTQNLIEYFFLNVQNIFYWLFYKTEWSIIQIIFQDSS